MDYKQEILLKKLNSILGTHEVKSKGNVAFYCPICKHHKKKLEVNLYNHKTHCWVCHFGAISIEMLFRKLKTSWEDILYARQLVGKDLAVQSDIKDIKLPDEFVPLYGSSGYQVDMAIRYLNNRKITMNHIKKYNIGYCCEGEFGGRIIIPSYTKVGILNYFVARDFMGNKRESYKNPSFDKRNIIIFEKFINFKYPIILVEGVFDAITATYNAVPILGTNVLDKLIYEISISDNEDIYVALDKDAFKISMELCKMLLSIGKRPHFVDFSNSEYKDINEMGHEEFMVYLNKAENMEYNDIIKKRLEKL